MEFTDDEVSIIHEAVEMLSEWTHPDDPVLDTKVLELRAKLEKEIGL